MSYCNVEGNAPKIFTSVWTAEAYNVSQSLAASTEKVQAQNDAQVP